MKHRRKEGKRRDRRDSGKTIAFSRKKNPGERGGRKGDMCDADRYIVFVSTLLLLLSETGACLLSCTVHVSEIDIAKIPPTVFLGRFMMMTLGP